MSATQESVFTLRYIPALGVSFFARALLSMRCPRMPIRIQIIIQIIIIINCNGNDYFFQKLCYWLLLPRAGSQVLSGLPALEQSGSSLNKNCKPVSNIFLMDLLV